MKKLCALIMAIAFLLPSISIYSVPASALQPIYSDILVHEAKEEIILWSQRGILQGSDGMFRPDDLVTRAEFAAIVNRLMGYTTQGNASFKDVPSDSWYYKDIMALNHEGIILGYGVLMQPETYISNEQVAVMLARAFCVGDGENRASGFVDDDNVSSWAKASVNAMKASDYITGTRQDNGISFRPKANATRADIVLILSRMFDKFFADNYDEDTFALCNSAFIRSGNSKLNDIVVRKNLYIAPAAGQSAIELSNVEITGSLFIFGSATISISGRFSADAIHLHGQGAASKIINNTSQPLPSAMLHNVTGLPNRMEKTVSMSPSSAAQIIDRNHKLWSVYWANYKPESVENTELGEWDFVMVDVNSVLCKQWVTFALDHHETLWGWGTNVEGQLGAESSTTPVVILRNVRDYDANGSMYSMAVSTDNELYIWGTCDYLLPGRKYQVLDKPMKIMSGVKAISAKADYGLATKFDNSLWSWAVNDDGTYYEYKLLDDVLSLQKGMAITSDHKLYAFELNERKDGLVSRFVCGDVISAHTSAAAWYAINAKGQLISWPIDAAPEDSVIIAEDGSYIVNSHFMAYYIDGSSRLYEIDESTGKTALVDSDVLYAAASVDNVLIYVKSDGALWMSRDRSGGAEPSILKTKIFEHVKTD